MDFQDNWVLVKGGVIVDPVLKLRIDQAVIPETERNEVDLRSFYDPEIDADHLLVPISEEERRKITWSDMPPGTLVIFESDKCDRIFYGLGLRWNEVGDTLRVKAVMSDHGFSLKLKLIKFTDYPVISEHPKDVILHVLKGFVKVNELRGYSIYEKYPSVKHLEMCLPSEQAFGLFGLNKAACREVEPGWVAIASREVGQARVQMTREVV